MRFLLVVVSVFLLAGCAQVSGPLKLYFISSARFTSGNRAKVAAGDTLATSLYAVTSAVSGQAAKLTNFRAVVTYSPRREPFAYPAALNLFIATPPSDAEVVYLDTTLNAANFLFTPVFGVRTTSGSENWTFTATDAEGNKSARSFITTVRYTDSLKLYHNYLLKLRVPATKRSDRRFIDLKSGIALPAYTVLGSVANPTLQQLTDVVVLPNGLSLVSTDSLELYQPFSSARWGPGNRSTTRFRLTTLLPADFTGTQDTTAIINQFAGPGRAYLRTLAVGQVYAFQAHRLPSNKAVYGLMRVVSVPNGTTAVGLQLEIRLAKQPLLTL
ncbi:hypothetical protein QMK33_13260 [Hymenobacter sp. H14-R3]|uniref:hypothetical protein n=1 Tax=Hymenobacter sp. H14-R3 TaxID=3046308 RepID=UPI0024BB8CC3|nr:hypothetical protein [Hymenobacter sp. H14-R3]MDJ0366124.1 hypothetical protein [Hymenobacter sp. H14-R3]